MPTYGRRFQTDARLLGVGKLVASAAIAFTLLVPAVPSLAGGTSPFARTSVSSSHRAAPVQAQQTRGAMVLGCARKVPMTARTRIDKRTTATRTLQVLTAYDRKDAY